MTFLIKLAILMDYFVALLKVAAFFSPRPDRHDHCRGCLPLRPHQTEQSLDQQRCGPRAETEEVLRRLRHRSHDVLRSGELALGLDFVQTLSLELILTEIKMAAVTWETY